MSPNQGAFQAFAWRDRGILQRTSVRIVDVTAEIRKKHLHYTSLERWYCFFSKGTLWLGIVSSVWNPVVGYCFFSIWLGIVSSVGEPFGWVLLL
jgi:hypothetical protein